MRRDLTEREILFHQLNPPKPTLAESLENAALREYEPNWKIPTVYERDFCFSTLLLQSAVFRPAIGPRASGLHMKLIPTAKSTATSTRDVVRLSGEELRQDDESLLLAIIKRLKGQSLDRAQNLSIQFKPRVFVREDLNWPDSGVSTAKLMDCIRRLKKTHLDIRYAFGGEHTVSFISDYEAPKGKDWTIHVAPRLAQMFAGKTTFLRVDTRQLLDEGLQTWLFGLVNASPWKRPMPVSELQSLAGDTKPQKKFVYRLKATLQVLLSKGVITEFSVQGGLVTIVRADT